MKTILTGPDPLVVRMWEHSCRLPILQTWDVRVRPCKEDAYGGMIGIHGRVYDTETGAVIVKATVRRPVNDRSGVRDEYGTYQAIMAEVQKQLAGQLRIRWSQWR